MDKRFSLDKYIGIPYVPHGRDPNIGLDCWGLILVLVNEVLEIALPDRDYTLDEIDRKLENKEVNTACGISILPELANAKDKIQVSDYVFEIDRTKIQFGDLVMFTLPRLFGMQAGVHIGMCINRQRVIHATKRGVLIQEIRMINNKILGAYRVKYDKNSN